MSVLQELGAFFSVLVCCAVMGHIFFRIWPSLCKGGKDEEDWNRHCDEEENK